MAWWLTSMETKRPQLNSEEMLQLRWLIGSALTLLSVSTVFYLDVEAWTLMALTTAAVVAGLVWPAWPAKVPKLVHTLAFPTLVLLFLGDFWITGQILPSLVRLDISLLLYRSASHRQRRDDLQIIVLGLFLIVVAGVLTVSPLFAVQIVAFAGCALAFLLNITVAESAGGGAGVAGGGWRVAEGGAPAWAVNADWRRLWVRLRAVSDWRLLLLGVALFAGVVAVSALLFLAIPRFQLENSLFIERFISKKARTGFNDSIKFGDVTEIQQDESVALSVDVSDPMQVPAMPYWRMVVLDEHREGGFRFSPVLSREVLGRERTSAVVAGTQRRPPGEPVYWTFYLESGVSRYLPLPGRFNELRFREAQNFRASPELALVRLREEPATMTAYRLESVTFAEALPDGAFAARWRDRERGTAGNALLQQRLNLNPADRETVERVVGEVRGGSAFAEASADGAGAGEFGRRASAWLLANHAYSLSPQIPKGAGDPLVRWLDSKEAGHCELFAGAFVLLARTAGYPARVVVGFKGGTWNGYSNSFTVRNANAHAWAELWDETRGAWLRVDPLAADAGATANAARTAAALAQGADRSWTARFDSLRVFWYRRIVNFDARSQVETLTAVKEATQSVGRGIRDALQQFGEKVKTWLAGPWDVQRFVRVAMSVVAVGAVGWAVRLVRGANFGGRWKARAGGQDPVRKEAGRWLQRLNRGTGEISAAANDADWMRTREELLRLRFGAKATWAEPAAVWRRARGVERAVRRRRGR